MPVKYSKTAHKQDNIHSQREHERRTDFGDTEAALENLQGTLNAFGQRLNNMEIKWGFGVEHNGVPKPRNPLHNTEIINFVDTENLKFTVDYETANPPRTLKTDARRVNVSLQEFADDLCDKFARLQGYINLIGSRRNVVIDKKEKELIYGFFWQYDINEQGQPLDTGPNYALDYDQLMPLPWESRYGAYDLDSNAIPVLWRGLRFHTDLWDDSTQNEGFVVEPSLEATKFHCVKEGLYNIRIKLRGITDQYNWHDPSSTMLMLCYAKNNVLMDTLVTSRFQEQGTFAGSLYYYIDMEGNQLHYLNEGDQISFGIKAYTATSYPGNYTEDTDLIFYIDDIKRFFQLTVEAYRIGGKQGVTVGPPSITFET